MPLLLRGKKAERDEKFISQSVFFAVRNQGVKQLTKMPFVWYNVK